MPLDFFVVLPWLVGGGFADMVVSLVLLFLAACAESIGDVRTPGCSVFRSDVNFSKSLLDDC